MVCLGMGFHRPLFNFSRQPRRLEYVMKFKSPEVEKEFHQLSVFLQYMAAELDEYSRNLTGIEIVVTRVKEFIPGDSGVHEANRAFDVRNESGNVFTYTDEQAKMLCDFMNQKYPRNDGKPTMINHSFENGPFHLHCQIATMFSVYEPVSKLT